MKSMVSFLIRLVFCVVFFNLISNSSRAAEEKKYVVVELFTSQSCSSCPAADSVLQKLATNPEIITLGYHVSYWNHLQWKDTLSLPEATTLQKNFNAQRGSRSVYTPQMAVNGNVEFVGSHYSKALSEIKKSYPLRLIELRSEKNRLHIDLPKYLSGADGFSLMILTVGKDTAQHISTGENAGKTPHYVSPVTTIQYVSTSAKQSTWVDMEKTQDKIVVIMRKGLAGPIVAVGAR